MMNYKEAAALVSACQGSHLILWKDEIGDPFVLTKYMEIYVYSATCLGCYCWHKKTYLKLQETGLIFNAYTTDDSLHFFQIDARHLPMLISLGAFKRRPRKKGRWVKDKEKLLGHRILPVDNQCILKKYRSIQSYDVAA